MERLAAQGEATGVWSAFTDSYRSTMPVVYRYLYRGTAGDVQLAEELTQATFEVALRAFVQGQRHALEPAWLHTVARSRLIDHFRRAKRERAKLTLLAGHRGHDVELPGELSAAEARAALQALSAPYRLALMLRYLDDLSVAEVADLLGRSVRATESLLRGLASRCEPLTRSSVMPADDVRDVFERVDAAPSAQFTEALLGQLRAEYLRAGLDTRRDAGPPAHEQEGTIMVDVLDAEPRLTRGGGPERPRGRRSRRRIAVAAAAAVLAAGVIAAGTVLMTRTRGDHHIKTKPAATGLAPTIPTTVPSNALTVPSTVPGDGSTEGPLLPNGVASTPPTSDLVAAVTLYHKGAYRLYVDGRLIRENPQTGTGPRPRCTQSSASRPKVSSTCGPRSCPRGCSTQPSHPAKNQPALSASRRASATVTTCWSRM